MPCISTCPRSRMHSECHRAEDTYGILSYNKKNAPWGTFNNSGRAGSRKAARQDSWFSAGTKRTQLSFHQKKPARVIYQHKALTGDPVCTHGPGISLNHARPIPACHNLKLCTCHSHYTLGPTCYIPAAGCGIRTALILIRCIIRHLLLFEKRQFRNQLFGRFS